MQCGDWNDITIFRFALKHCLDENERVECDDGHVGEDPANVKVPASMVHDQDEKQKYVRTKVRRRHETANKRIKQFDLLDNVFQYPKTFHAPCFRAAAVLTQLSINNGSPLFSTDEYTDNTDALPVPPARAPPVYKPWPGPGFEPEWYDPYS